METVVMTASAGFIGRNLVATLALQPDLVVRTFGREAGSPAHHFWASELFDPQWSDTHALPV